MKLRIITTDRTVLSWRSLDAKLTAIAAALNQTKGATWEVTIEHRDVKPQIVNGRITHDWFNQFSYPYFRQGFEHVYLHFSMADWTALGLDQGIRGANHKDSDYVGESYGRGDETTRRGKSRQNQFVQNVLHEMSHELHRSTGVPDRTHEYHDKNPDISGIFKTLDMTKWQPRYQEQRSTILSLIAKARELLARKVADRLTERTSLFHPVQLTPRRITQPYGVPSSRYKWTGHHIGTDYAIPVGTPLYAPADGEVTSVGTGKATGHFLHFRYEFQGETFEERWCHLASLPARGRFKRGVKIAKSGNTGESTGPHLHRERWRNEVQLENIDRSNFRELTVDPEA